ncbi:trypsin-like peptidase domain-containing protein [Pseudomonas sp. S12(2018)]|uniref:trypsin-like peptidase domain-containing protein n=1 Tax=Pseudomonas sp. S12(2018) TaxID=2219664 RepID=UPI0020CFAD35|nr:trypsin-like peptidase domain-containing protein [Pseudomonas sp. S12(2018)]
MAKRTNPLNDRQMADSNNAMHITMNFLSRFSLPIYKDMTCGRPELIGTGFVIDFHDRYYFVSAAHVMDHHEYEQPLFYFTNTKNRQYIQGASRTSSQDIANRKNDHIDLTVVKLPIGQGQPEDEIGKRAIPSSLIAQDTSKIDDCRLILSGYPLTKQKPDDKNKLLNTSCYTWIGKSISNDVYRRLKFKKSKNLLVQFERKNIVGLDGLRGTMFPEPRGVSGSPVWQTVGYRNEERILVIDGFLLAGVLIEHIPEGKCFLATSIDIVMQMVIDLHLSLSE